MIVLWLRGVLRRPWWVVGEIGGVAVAVAVVAGLGLFLTQSRATMTTRAVRDVGVDWQVQVQPGADPAAVAGTLAAATAVDATAIVGFAGSPGLTVVSGPSTQTTGAAVILGIPADYTTLFPAQIRILTGDSGGALLAQQTAANLHAAVGDTVMIGRAGLPDAPVVVTGIVELPRADSLFQQIGATSSTRSAPPDNVVLLPVEQWHAVVDGLAGRPDLVSTQLHVRLDHALPADPAAAYTAVTAAANHAEAAQPGVITIGDNLAATLAAARSDAAYAQILFLFLGLPAVVLAALLTASVAAAGSGRRRAEYALLRARGAADAALIRLITANAAMIGAAGSIIGLAAAAVVGSLALGAVGGGAAPTAIAGWSAVAAGTGVGIAALSILLPARRDLRVATVAAARRPVSTPRYPVFARYGLDAVLLLAGALVVAATGRGGYQLVLAPEGSPTISVSYWAFVGPALLWLGLALLTWRVADLLLGRGRPLIRRAVRPLAGSLAAPLSAMLARQRRHLTRAIVLLALAVAFAASTATFNATFAQQAQVDAQLTNGADVTLTPAPGVVLPAGQVAAVAAIAGVRTVEPIQHRYAYIGNDLQDLYGVHAGTVGSATGLQDAYFTGGTAADLLSTLSREPDAILVSAETVQDYQLQIGDPLKLRLVDDRSRQLATVTFRYVGIVNEFPTAPKDSFFVANADYVARQTGSDAVGAYLINTGGQGTAQIAATLRDVVGPAAVVTDISSVRATVGSSLTAVDLDGLTRLELTFALILAAAAGGLVFGLTLADRRRSLAITLALGANRRQLRGLINGEAAVLGATGLAGGAVMGVVLSATLVAVLTGVFDPPPSAVAVPWTYLAAVLAAILTAVAAVSAAVNRSAHRDPLAVLREL